MVETEEGPLLLVDVGALIVGAAAEARQLKVFVTLHV